MKRLIITLHPWISTAAMKVEGFASTVIIILKELIAISASQDFIDPMASHLTPPTFANVRRQRTPWPRRSSETTLRVVNVKWFLLQF